MNQGRKGFTLIELMLAMGFVSALLMAIALTVIQIGNIYNQGITYKTVNQVGAEISSELTRTINSSAPFTVTVDGSGIGENYINNPDWGGGRLCTGQYSYIWNYGKSFIGTKNPYRNVYSNSTNEIDFVKVADPGALYCQTPQKKVDSTGAIEMIGSQNGLAIHFFSISSSVSDSSTGESLYNISFKLGTNDQTSLDQSNISCRIADDHDSDPNYCAVNQFNLTIRSGGASQ